jgi:hypothetical protein
MERETGVEPATSTLARSHSTTELLPLQKQLRDYIAMKMQGQTEFMESSECHHSQAQPSPVGQQHLP